MHTNSLFFIILKMEVLTVFKSSYESHFSDVMKNSVAVGTLKFVLFLYIQQIHKVSLKASLVAGDEYPLLCDT